MFMQAYQDMMEDDQTSQRSEEREMITETINLMRASDQQPDDRVLRSKAIHLTSQLWNYFLNDLVSEENETPRELKASIISIGIFIVKHLERMRLEKTLAFKPVADISETIREGLN
ncbi:MAG: flagellar biosynthesis regulator FlaF [Pseudomonadota bacterium]